MNKLSKAMCMGVMYAFLYIPLLVVIINSFNSSAYSANSWEGFTFDWYKSLLTNRDLIAAARNSVILAITAATAATVIGTLGAIGFYRFKVPGKNFFYALIYIVLMSPEIVMGIALLVVFTQVHFPMGFLSVLILHITFALPFVMITIFTRLAGFDKNLVEASKDLGADELRTFTHVMMPMLLPAVLSGWLLSFTISMDDAIGAPFVTSNDFQLLPIWIFGQVKRGVSPEINALSAIMFVVSILLIILSQIILHWKPDKQQKVS